MLNYVPPQAFEPTIIDTMQRTSSYNNNKFLDSLIDGYIRSTNYSEFLTKRNEFENLYSDLSQLASVQENWNSYGSPAPTEPSIEKARSILSALESAQLVPSKVMPSAEGGVAFVFMSQTENRAVLESLNSMESFILLYDRNGNSKTLDWDDSASHRSNLLDRLKDHLKGANLATS